MIDNAKRIGKQALLTPARWMGSRWHVRREVSPPELRASARGRVLLVGIYLADRQHSATHLAQCYASSRSFAVTQAWVALGGEPDSPELAALTVEKIHERVPKFTILNRILGRYDLASYDFVIVSDDDVTVPRGFLDAFLGYQEKYDFALAQPARTLWSYSDSRFVRQRLVTEARLTRFVEIGPVFSIRRDLVPRLVPFDETSPMGWGYDLVWPLEAEAMGLRLGIVDATPVDHSLRKQSATYSAASEIASMQAYLGRHHHLKGIQAMVVLESYRASPFGLGSCGGTPRRARRPSL